MFNFLTNCLASNFALAKKTPWPNNNSGLLALLIFSIIDVINFFLGSGFRLCNFSFLGLKDFIFFKFIVDAWMSIGISNQTGPGLPALDK